MTRQDKDSKFYFFHYTRKSVNSCCIAIDSPMSENASDAQRGDQCVAECQWLCWPLVAVFDIVSLPYRGPKHLIKKCVNKCKKNNKNKKNKD
jgi:hypothetical protein